MSPNKKSKAGQGGDIPAALVNCYSRAVTVVTV
jgi:hypothetical protein